jgi:hypothetical protein
MRALAKDYHQRYSTIIEFAENYASAVQTALQRFTFASAADAKIAVAPRRCSACGADYDDRSCPYCDTPCALDSVVAQFAVDWPPPMMVAHSPLSGVSARQGLLCHQHVLKHTEETKVMTAIAIDTQVNDQDFAETLGVPPIFLSLVAKELVYYEKATLPLITTSPSVDSCHT